MSLLSIAKIEKSYGPIKVLHGMDAAIEEGEIFAIIGPNGAGKTTLFKVMTGEAYAESGTVHFAGKDVTRDAPHLRARAGMGRTFQVARVFIPLKALDNVVIAIEARKRGCGQKDRVWWTMRPSGATIEEAMHLLAGVSLAHKAHVIAADLSHGDRKRLELVITLAGRPKILMMDEPTAGMSPSERDEISQMIRAITTPVSAGGLLAEGQRLTIVMTEHDMSVIFGLAHRILVMNQGREIALGTVDAIRANPQVREVYLGTESQILEMRP